MTLVILVGVRDLKKNGFACALDLLLLIYFNLADDIKRMH